MATTLAGSGSLNSNVQLTKDLTGNYGPVTSPLPISHSMALTSGAGTGAAQNSYCIQDSVGASSSLSYQVSSSGSLKNCFGDAVALTILKKLVVQNCGPGALTVQPTSGVATNIPCGTDMIVRPGGCLALVYNAAQAQVAGTANTDAAGVAISAGTTDKIKITCDSTTGGAYYNLEVTGV